MTNPQLIARSVEDALLQKWAPVLDADKKNGKLKPLETKHSRISTAMILENQENYCVGRGAGRFLTEANVSAGAPGAGGVFGNAGPASSFGGQQGDTYASGDARLPQILIPMLRRTFPELITNKIVGVQPMSGPVGLAFAMRFKYNGVQLDNANTTGYTQADGQPVGAGYGVPAGARAADGTVQRVSNAGGVGGEEIGTNNLDNAFTGARNADLADAYDSANSGVSTFIGDQGTAALLSQFEMSSNFPQVEVAFEKTAVQAGTRRLSAKWSVELEQDLKNMNGIDIDTELVNAMSYEVQAEIDREMVIRMIQAAVKGGLGQGYSIWTPLTANGRWIGEIGRDFYQKLLVEANRIAVRNRRGSANFIIATPRVCSILEALPEFAFMPVAGTNINTQQTGVAEVGTLASRFNIYRDTRTEVQNPAFGGFRTAALEYALLGYKGNEYWDTGIIYCPYIPIMVQRTVHPTTFTPNVGLLTRYGVVDNIFGSNLYYHLILLKDLGTPYKPNDPNKEVSYF